MKGHDGLVDSGALGPMDVVLHLARYVHRWIRHNIRSNPDVSSFYQGNGRSQVFRKLILDHHHC
jgi:hypothetical protein